MNMCVTWGEALVVTCSDSQGLFSFCTCTQSYKRCTLFDLILTWLSPSADPLLNATFLFFFFCVLISFSDRSVLPFSPCSLISSYLFLPSVLASFLSLPQNPPCQLLASFWAHMHACMHTHSIKVKHFILVLTVAIKGAPTKCCNPFIIWLLPHSMRAALPFGSSLLSRSLLLHVCARSRVERKWETEYK